MTTLTGDSTKIDPGFETPPENPLSLLKHWLKTAETLDVSEPRGFVLSTVDHQGKPSSRVVLLKDIIKDAIIFGTSSNSIKGLQLANNHFAAGNLWWRETLQQVSFQSMVNPTNKEFSEKMFAQRSREAQAVAAISAQSEPMYDENGLREKIQALIESKQIIECPNAWSAYSFKIDTIEFWLGNKNRFHQRLKYRLENGNWKYVRLQP